MRGLILLATFIALTGCSRIIALQSSVADLDKQNDSLRTDLARIEQNQKDQAEELKTNKISLELALQHIEEQLGQLSGNVNESQARLTDINQKTGELTAQLREKAQKDSLKVTLANNERKDMFDLGVKDYQLGNFKQALSTFAAFFEAYPKAPELADATYWNAESFLGAKKYDEAEAGFKTYIKDFKEGSFFCTAIYKLGLVYQKKDDATRRDAIWEELKNRCPDTKEAKLVKEKK